MVTMELTMEEARAIADLIRGNPVDTRWLCSVFNKAATFRACTPKIAEPRPDGVRRS